MSDVIGPPIATRQIYAGRVIAVRESDYRRPDGLVVQREVVDHPGAVAIVAVDGNDVLLVRQPREAVERRVLEIPAGKLEPGEDPLDCARRELTEEVGVRAEHWESLGRILMAPAILTEVIHLFVATDLSPASAPGDPDEDIEIVRRPLTDLDALLEELEDAKSIVGLARYAGRRSRH